MEQWIQEEIEKLKSEYGDVPPPWTIINEHPLNLCWRMGGGEGHLILWHDWWESLNLSEQERIAYFRKWPPPHCWLEFLIEAIWNVILEDYDGDIDFFELTEQLGFGSEEEYKRDFSDKKWLETTETPWQRFKSIFRFW